VTAILDLLGSWDAVWLFFGVAFLLGFAPGAALRLILLLYPRDHPRRQELIGELYAMGRIERPVFVFEQLELAIFEGIHLRRARRRERVRSRAKQEARDRWLAVAKEILEGLPPQSWSLLASSAARSSLMSRFGTSRRTGGDAAKR
jgi:hypothetical protein